MILYDDLLKQDLPAGAKIKTVKPWNGEGNTLLEQQENIVVLVILSAGIL